MRRAPRRVPVASAAARLRLAALGDAHAGGPADDYGSHSSSGGSRQQSAERTSTWLVVLVWLRVTDRLLDDFDRDLLLLLLLLREPFQMQHLRRPHSEGGRSMLNGLRNKGYRYGALDTFDRPSKCRRYPNPAR